MLVAFAAMGSQLSAAAGGGRGVVPVPAVRVSARAIQFHGDRAMLVRSITVSHIAKVHLRVTCEHCVRYPTPIRETKPKPGSKRFAGVNWIIVVGRHIRVSVTRRGKVGRYLVLGVGKAKNRDQDSLLFIDSGCLGQDLETVACPRHTRSPSKGAHVKGGSPKPTDSIAPNTPGGLTVSAVSETAVSVRWTASSDNVGVAGYALLRDGSRVASTAATSFAFSGLSCGHVYRLGVAAYDAAGNLSTPATLTVSTAACPPSDRMSHEESLLAASSQYLQSPDGRFRFVMQADGNIVLYGPSGALWSSGTLGTKARELRMQNDGNLVLYDQTSKGVWSSNTSHHYNAFLVVQNDGNVVIYEGGTALWSTGTAGST
jgi:hypothetical protein